jgi:hypothetical protein
MAVRHANAEYSDNGNVWKPLRHGRVLCAGQWVKTAPRGTLDLFLKHSGSGVRIMENSILRLRRLERRVVGATNLTDTVLDLCEGQILCHVKPPAPGSSYEIRASYFVCSPREANIETELAVSAEGRAEVLTGKVTAVSLLIPGPHVVSVVVGGEQVAQAQITTNSATRTALLRQQFKELRGSYPR